MGFRPGVPAVTVQCAFGVDPNTNPSGWTWTTIVGRVTAVDVIRSSRSDELGTYQAGTATISMLNTDGALNPTNSSGPWFGMLRPYVPIRVQTTLAGSTTTRWQGYVRQWPQAWADPALGVAKIGCVDAYAPLNQIDLDSAYAAEVLLDSPTVYYPTGESSGSSTAGNASGNSYPPAQIVHTKSANGATPGTYQFGQTLNIVGAATQTGLQLAGHNLDGAGGTEDGYGLILPQFVIDWSVPWTAEIWVSVTSAAQLGTLLYTQDAVHPKGVTGPSGTWPAGMINLWVHSDDKSINFNVADSNGAHYVTGNGVYTPLFDGKPHLVTLTYDNNSTLTVQVAVDGVFVTSASTSTWATGIAVTSFGTLGVLAANAQTLPAAPVQDGQPLVGTIGQFAFYPLNAFTAGSPRTAARVTAGLTAFSGELSGQRATRLLGYGGWQTPMQTVQTGRSTMSPASGIAGNSLLAELQNVVDAEQGALTVTADGKIDFRGRDDRMIQTTPTITFGSNIAGGEIPYSLPDLGLSLEDTLIVDDFQISRPNGITAEAADAAAIGHYFPRTKQITMDVDTDDQVQYAADWLLAREKQPAQRLQQIIIDAANFNPASFPGSGPWPALLGLDLHKRARMIHRPMGAPAITIDGFVEQVHDTIDFGAGTWQIGTWLSPVLADYLIPDDSVQGFTDSTFVIAF